MALFPNLGVKLRGCLCDVPRYASAQPLVCLDLAENCLFLNWKLMPVPICQKVIYGWALLRIIRAVPSRVQNVYSHHCGQVGRMRWKPR